MRSVRPANRVSGAAGQCCGQRQTADRRDPLGSANPALGGRRLAAASQGQPRLVAEDVLGRGRPLRRGHRGITGRSNAEDSRWRVSVGGVIPTDEGGEELWSLAREWALDNAPSSRLLIEGSQWSRFEDGTVTTGELTATVDARDAGAATAVVRSALEHILPALQLTRIVTESSLALPAGEDAQLTCSFCGKLQRHVQKLIAGPGVYVCDQSLDLMVEIMREESPGGPTLDRPGHGEAPKLNHQAAPPWHIR